MNRARIEKALLDHEAIDGLFGDANSEICQELVPKIIRGTQYADFISDWLWNRLHKLVADIILAVTPAQWTDLFFEEREDSQ